MTATPSLSVSLRHKALFAAAILVAFTAFSLWVIAGHGIFGFLIVARDEPWGLQMLLDLAIACSFGLGWLAQDARKRGITTTWPFYVATICTGSIGLLAYAVRRGYRVNETPPNMVSSGS